jgi:hypothetical protein
MTRVIALPRALPGKTCAVTIARETRWDSPSEGLNQHSAPGHKRSSKVQTHDQKAAVDFRYRLIHYGDDI